MPAYIPRVINPSIAPDGSPVTPPWDPYPQYLMDQQILDSEGKVHNELLPDLQPYIDASPQMQAATNAAAAAQSDATQALVNALAAQNSATAAQADADAAATAAANAETLALQALDAPNSAAPQATALASVTFSQTGAAAAVALANGCEGESWLIDSTQEAFGQPASEWLEVVNGEVVVTAPGIYSWTFRTALFWDLVDTPDAVWGHTGNSHAVFSVAGSGQISSDTNSNTAGARVSLTQPPIHRNAGDILVAWFPSLLAVPVWGNPALTSPLTVTLSVVRWRAAEPTTGN